MSEIRLPLPGFAYRFDLLLEFARRVAHPARMAVDRDALWRYTGGRLVQYRHTDDAIVISGESLDSSVARASERVLGLNRDLSLFYAYARNNARLWQVIQPLAGLPIFCAESVFEALIALIIEQHISWNAAMRAQRVMLGIFEDGADTPAGRVYDFPSPSQLAEATPAQLKPLKITDRRCQQIIDIARQVEIGGLDLEGLRELDDETATKRLMRIPGVGAWTAGNVIGRAFGRYPMLAVNDVALQAAVREYFHAGEGDKSAAQVNKTLGEYGEFAGMAGHFTLLRWVLDRYPPIN